MRKIFVLVPLLGGVLLLLAASAAFAFTGADWEDLPREQRPSALEGPMGRLRTLGVPLEGSAEDYASSLKDTLKENPALEEAELTDVLAANVYGSEGGSRLVIDRLRRMKKLTRGLY